MLKVHKSTLTILTVLNFATVILSEPEIGSHGSSTLLMLMFQPTDRKMASLRELPTTTTKPPFSRNPLLESLCQVQLAPRTLLSFKEMRSQAQLRLISGIQSTRLKQTTGHLPSLKMCSSADKLTLSHSSSRAFRLTRQSSVCSTTRTRSQRLALRNNWPGQCRLTWIPSIIPCCIALTTVKSLVRSKMLPAEVTPGAKTRPSLTRETMGWLHSLTCSPQTAAAQRSQLFSPLSA